MKYDPAIGIHGMDICVELGRAGWRVRARTRAHQSVGPKQRISKDECRDYLANELKVKFLE
jgi:large subunit ribosomal protein L5